jgi:hypothetical protein
MKLSKTIALATLIAASSAFVGATFAADSATPAKTPVNKEARAKCSKEAKEQNLAGAARKAHMKKCMGAAAPAAK